MEISRAIEIYGLKDDITFKKVYIHHPEHDNLTIIIVVVSGGPCAGKTDFVTILKEKSLLMNGFKVFVASEAAEHLISQHITFMDAGADQTFQREIILQQLAEEKNVVMSAIKYKIAHPDDTVICLFDRSLLDGQAYFSDPDEYTEILADYGLTPKKVFERSDRVIFMQSTANGAEEYYKVTGIRSEPLHVAKRLDRNVRKAWEKHPDFQPILNKDFNKYEEKIYTALGKVFELIGKDAFGSYKVTYIVAKDSAHNGAL